MIEVTAKQAGTLLKMRALDFEAVAETFGQKDPSRRASMGLPFQNNDVFDLESLSRSPNFWEACSRLCHKKQKIVFQTIRDASRRDPEVGPNYIKHVISKRSER